VLEKMPGRVARLDTFLITAGEPGAVRRDVAGYVNAGRPRKVVEEPLGVIRKLLADIRGWTQSSPLTPS
jgi:hypothetical protein